MLLFCGFGLGIGIINSSLKCVMKGNVKILDVFFREIFQFSLLITYLLSHKWKLLLVDLYYTAFDYTLFSKLSFWNLYVSIYSFILAEQKQIPVIF